MQNSTIFFLLTIIGFALFIVGLFIKPIYQRHYKTPADIAGFDLAWQYSLIGFFIAVLPFPIYYIGLEGVMWRICSLVAAGLLFVSVVMVFTKMMSVGARWPLITVFLLVLSLVFIIIEVANVIIWGGSVEYLVGVVWTIGLAIVQYLSVYYYDYLNPPPQSAHKQNIPDAGGYGVRPAISQRVRRNPPADHPDRSPFGNSNRNRHGDGNGGQRKSTYTHPVERARPHGGWTVPHAPVRTDNNTQRR